MTVEYLGACACCGKRPVCFRVVSINGYFAKAADTWIAYEDVGGADVDVVFSDGSTVRKTGCAIDGSLVYPPSENVEGLRVSVDCDGYSGEGHLAFVAPSEAFYVEANELLTEEHKEQCFEMTKN